MALGPRQRSQTLKGGLGLKKMALGSNNTVAMGPIMQSHSLELAIIMINVDC